MNDGLTAAIGRADLATPPHDDLLVAERWGRVRLYHLPGGSLYMGVDTSDLVHFCGPSCFNQWNCGAFVATSDPNRMVDGMVLVYRADEITTLDLGDLDTGDDPYVVCAHCEDVLVDQREEGAA